MILLHLPLDRGGIIWEWIWNTDEVGRWLKKKKKGEINFRGKGLAHLMNSCPFCLSLSSPQPFLCKDETDEKKNPHTVTVREVLCGQSITGCSSLLTDFQCANGCEGGGVCESVCVGVIIHGCRPFTFTAPDV